MSLLCVTGLRAQVGPVGLDKTPLPGPDKIARVTVVGNVHVATADIIAKLKAKNSTTPTADLVAAARGMGVFNSVKVTTTRDLAGGTDVTCIVIENPVVRVIKITANTLDGKPSVPVETLIAHMQTAVGQVLNTNTLVSDLDTLFNHNTGYMRAQGYVCDVSNDINIDPNGGVLTIPLIEAFVDKVEIQGNGPVPAADVLSALRTKPGDVLDLNALQQGLNRLAETHRFAEVGPARYTPGQVGKVTLTVPLRVPRGPFGTITAGVAPAAVTYGGFLGGFVVVPVRVNDHAVGHFLLVTNSDLSEISGVFSNANGLTPQPMLEGGHPYFVGGQPASSVSLDRLTLGGASGVTVQSLSLPVADLSATSKQIGQMVDGILGADLLSRMAVGIDFPRRRVTFWDHGHLSVAERSAAGFGEAAQVPVAPLFGTLLMPAAAARIQNGTATKAVSIVVATGNQTSLMPRADAATLGMTPLPNPDDPATVLCRAEHLDFGGLSLNAPLFQLNDAGTNTALGLNVLQQHRLLLDGPAQTAFFAPEVTVSSGGSRPAGLSVPFLFDHLTIPYPVVQVSINGRPPLPFVFDTGTSSALAVDREAARTLGLVVDPETSGTLNGSIPVQTAAVSTAVLEGRTPADNVEVSLEQAIVTDLGLMRDSIIGPRIAGIVGAGMLSGTAVRFDFSEKMLTFFPGSADVASSTEMVTLPLSERINEGNYFTTLAPTSGPPVRLVVDTGSVDTNLPYEMLPGLRPSHRTATGRWMLGSIALGQSLLLSGLPFAGMPTGALSIDVFPTNETSERWHPATLGLDILSRLAVTLDIPHMRLLLGPPPTPVPPIQDGWVGIRLAQTGSRFAITRVLPASPADHAELKAGDILLAVDGRPLTGLSLSLVHRLVDGVARTPISFLTQHAGTPPRMVRFRRGNLSDEPPGPLDGIFGVREAANPFVVSAVLAGCPAARAGIASGDAITAIDGQATPTLSPQQWETLGLMMRLTLTVTHSGVSRTVVLAGTPPRPPAGGNQH